MIKIMSGAKDKRHSKQRTDANTNQFNAKVASKTQRRKEDKVKARFFCKNVLLFTLHADDLLRAFAPRFKTLR
jgi:hypothetical protein